MVGIAIVIQFLEKEIDELLNLASDLRFDATHPLHQHTTSLYGTIIELSSALIPLFKTEHYSGVPIILRSILEAYVDLENLCRDPKYGYSLTIGNLKESLKFLRAAKDDDNVYMKIIAQAPDLDERILGIEAEITTLMDKGHKDLNKRQRFEKAEMIEEYKTIYNTLCSAAHNDLRSLRNRHMVLNKDSFSIEYFKVADLEELESYLGIAAELLLRASYAIHNLLESDKNDNLQKLRTELNKIREEV